MAAQPSNKPDLWQRAIETLPASVTEVLDTKKTGKRDVALAALKVAEAKRQQALKRRWRIRRSSSQDDIIVRDVMEKVIYWIRRFKEVGDQMVQYDPGHAALPWAAFRFLLQAAVNDTTIYTETVEDLEKVASLMARSLELERLYVATTSVLHKQLCEALVKTYAVVLHLLARAVKFFDELAVARLMKAPFRSLHEEDMKDILAAEAEVLKIAGLIDSERVLNLETQVLRLADFTIASKRTVEEQEYLDILSWLSRVPYSRHLASHRDTRLPGTGKWLVHHTNFRDWEATSSCSSLLLHGIAGCGKTSLCTAVIDKYLDDMSKTPSMAPLAYFYCNASDPEPERQSAEGVLRSLARQLTVSSLPSRQIHDSVVTLYQQSIQQAKSDGFEPAKVNISECVELILAALADNPATLVIDALDEVEEPKELVDALEAIIGKSGNVVKVFMTTRDDPGIFAMLPAANNIRVTNEYNRTDIRSFTVHAVDSAISEFKLLLGNVTKTLKERLVDGLVSGAGEMFLWVKLQILYLCSFKHEKDVLSALATFSQPTLEDLYRTGYQRIQQAGSASHEIAVCVFTWLLYAPELMSADTFLRAVVSTIKLEHLTADTVLAIGRGFVILDAQLNVFRFAHGSVRDFLSLQNAYKPDQGQRLLANSCLAICNDFPDNEITEFCPTESLYGYAALYCGHHLSAALYRSNDSNLVQDIYDFLFDDGEPSLSAKAWIDNVRAAYHSLPLDHTQKMAMEIISSEQCSPLFAICVFGLSSVLEKNAWPADCDWDQRNDYGHTYLYAASLSGYTQVAKFLLGRAASVNIECGRLGSALHCAAYRGHVEVVKLLLNHGADNKVGGKFENAVHAACQGNCEDVVLAILDHGSIITDQADYDQIVEAVCEAGFPRAIEALEAHALNHGAMPAKSILTFKKVIASGKVASLKYMSRKSTTRFDASPGSVALSSLHGHEAMTGYLLDQGYDIEEPGELGSPLRCACLNGHGSVCRLLVNRGADVNRNGRFGSGLHAAAMKGHAHIARLLLDAGADVNIKGGYYGTPLQAAAYQGHKQVLSRLLRGGADVHRSGFSKDAFHAAAEGGHHDIIRLLLDSGFTMLRPIPVDHVMFDRDGPPPRDLLRESSPDGRNQTRQGNAPEHCENGYHEGLFDLSNPTPHAQAYAPIQNGWTNGRESNYVLEAAAALGHLEVVEKLLAQPDYLDMTKSAITQALIVASRYGHQGIVEALLHTMEDDTVPLCKALQEAASHNHVSIVSMLLAHNREAQSNSAYLEAALKSSIRSKGEYFHTILAMTEVEVSEEEKDAIVLRCLPEAAARNRGDIVRIILSRNLDVDHQQLIDLINNACEKGDLEVVTSISTCMPYIFSSEKELSRCIRSAVEHGQTNVTRYLLPHFLKQSRQWHLRSMVLVAAGCGYVDILAQILGGMKDVRPEHDAQLLQQALNVAAENGHENTCAFLLSMGVDPCNLAPGMLWAYVSLKWLPYFCKEKGASSDLERQAHSKETEVEISKAYEDNGPTYPPRAEFNAIESCLFGFERFGQSFDLYTFQEGWKRGSSTEKSSTLRLLLQHTTSLKDCVRGEAIHAVVKHCDPSLITMMIEKGASVQAHHEKRSILDCAASRELLCLPVMQTLMQTRAIADIAKAELQHLLSTTLSQFYPRNGQLDHWKGFFAKTNTLQDLFTTGPGALAKFLLELLPEEKIACAAGSAFLQCAAAAGLVDFVKLAIDREADVNGVGSYYGTALQAASRFGHTSVVQQLLDAKADVNIRQGRYHTALRAAILGRSLKTVSLLLEAGASTELASHGSYQDDSTPLQLAIQWNEKGITQALLAAGAHIQVNQNEQQPLLIQACGHGDISIVNALLEAGADVQVQGHQRPRRRHVCEEDGSALHAAIEAEHMNLICFLLRKGFNLSADFGEFRSPLAIAARKGNPVVLEVLVRSALNLSNETLTEALREAVKQPKTQRTDHRLAVLQVDHDNCIFRNACHKGEENVLELLLEELLSRGQIKSACSAVLDDPRSIQATAFDTILEYIPCPVDLFVEACSRGHERFVRINLEQGMSPNVIDSKGRPALHLATIHASVVVTKLLLTYGAISTVQYPVYGTPLMTALEGSAIKSVSFTTLPAGAQEHARLLTGQTDVSIFPTNTVSGLIYVQTQHTEEIVRLLIEKGASPDQTPGTFGSTLTLAAFLGSRNIFDMLLQHGASLNTMGGYLHSPLLASIQGKHLKMAKHILELSASRNSGDSAEVYALHMASEKTSIPAVKLLLQYGMSPHLEDKKGKTPLYISVSKLASELVRRPSGHIDPSHEEAIVHLLLEAEPQTSITDDILCAASEIKNEGTRTKVLQKMLPRAGSHYFPEDAFRSLIKASRFSIKDDGGEFMQKLLDEKRIRHVTTSMLADTGRPEMITKLLDYDTTYKITTATLDAIVDQLDSRRMAEFLLKRDESFMPSGSNVLAVLKHRYIHCSHEPPSDKQIHILEMMFSRNSQLRVTEDMFIAVRHVEDLKVLLARTRPSEKLISAAVLVTLAKKRRDFELVKMILDFDRSALIPPDLANYLIACQDLDGLRCVWNHDPKLCISEFGGYSLIRSVLDRRDKDVPHADVVDLLRKHRGNWRFTREVRDAVDDRFFEQSDQEVRNLYYSLWDGDEEDDLSKNNAGSGALVEIPQ
jgi:ankyrin repeat protein